MKSERIVKKIIQYMINLSMDDVKELVKYNF